MGRVGRKGEVVSSVNESEMWRRGEEGREGEMVCSDGLLWSLSVVTLKQEGFLVYMYYRRKLESSNTLTYLQSYYTVLTYSNNRESIKFMVSGCLSRRVVKIREPNKVVYIKH